MGESTVEFTVEPTVKIDGRSDLFLPVKLAVSKKIKLLTEISDHVGERILTAVLSRISGGTDDYEAVLGGQEFIEVDVPDNYRHTPSMQLPTSVPSFMQLPTSAPPLCGFLLRCPPSSYFGTTAFYFGALLLLIRVLPYYHAAPSRVYGSTEY